MLQKDIVYHVMDKMIQELKSDDQRRRELVLKLIDSSFHVYNIAELLGIKPDVIAMDLFLMAQVREEITEATLFDLSIVHMMLREDNYQENEIYKDYVKRLYNRAVNRFEEESKKPDPMNNDFLIILCKYLSIVDGQFEKKHLQN